MRRLSGRGAIDRNDEGRKWPRSVTANAALSAGARLVRQRPVMQRSAPNAPPRANGLGEFTGLRHRALRPITTRGVWEVRDRGTACNSWRTQIELQLLARISDRGPIGIGALRPACDPASRRCAPIIMQPLLDIATIAAPGRGPTSSSHLEALHTCAARRSGLMQRADSSYSLIVLLAPRPPCADPRRRPHRAQFDPSKVSP